MFKNIAFIILAAGKGKRMQNMEIPKPLQKLTGRPLIGYILKTLQKIGIQNQQIWIVTHYHEDQIRKVFSDYQFAHQKQLDGTAGAARDALEEIPDYYDHIAIFSADDTMFYLSETITEFIQTHFHQSSPMSLLTVIKKSDYLGGLLRDQKNQAKMILAPHPNLKNLIKQREIICGGYVFDRLWLLKTIAKLSKLPNGEIGLPYLVDIAYQENTPANVYQLKNPDEWMSVNTPEELKEAQRNWDLGFF